jgi:putative transposase
MNLAINVVIEWLGDRSQARVERVLFIDPSGTLMVTIDIDPEHKKALPIWRKCEEVSTAIAVGDARLLDADAYEQPARILSNESRKHRDEIWDIIKPLIEGDKEKGWSKEDIFFAEKRGQMIAQVSESSKRAKRLIYTYLRRYWQGGQIKNALVPHYHKSGGKGKERQAKDRKRGRPRGTTKTGQSLEAQASPGVNITPEIRKVFQRGIRLFYENRDGRTLREAWQLTKEQFFHKGFELRNGVLVPLLPPAEELPTFEQFRYWYEKEQDITRAVTFRVGQRRFDTSHRPLLGNPMDRIFGPGSQYQIDATAGDIYLVSELDPSRIIGRPVIYIVIDAFSRAIAGMSVNLRGPSWLGAMLALENAAIDKVAFCKEYGIDIEKHQWPHQDLPESILGDRGELEGYNADNLVNALGIQVAITAPYRCDWKGIVEQNFRLTNDSLIDWLPGRVYHKRDRGDPDYRLEACLTLRQFRKLMIYCILHHNNQHRMNRKTYRPDEFMIPDHIEPYPIDIWRWGMDNRIGHLNKKSLDKIRWNLLPEKEASVTRRGIIFEGMRYSCKLAMEEQWFVKAGETGSWPISVAYDPRKTDLVYIRLDSGQRLEPCSLLDAEKVYKERDLQDVQDYFELQKKGEKAAETREQQAEAAFHAQVKSVVEEAQERAKDIPKGLSKRSRTTNIRRNRSQEIALIDQMEVWSLAPEQASKPLIDTEQTPNANQSTENERKYIPPPRPIEALRKLRQERLKNEQ